VTVPNSALSVLLHQIDEASSYFDARRPALRANDLMLFASQACLTALTTVLVGLEVTGYETVLKNFALVSSALAGLLTILAGRLRYRERYVTYTVTSSSLAALKSKIEFYQEFEPAQRDLVLSLEAINKLHVDFQSILDHADENWRHLFNVTSSGNANSGPAPAHSQTLV
jgi:hypothetical protein